MNLSEALSIATEACELRAEMWNEAAWGYLAGSKVLDCFYESGHDECKDMEARLNEAIETIDMFTENSKALLEEIDGWEE
jgi:hypothetical protein